MSDVTLHPMGTEILDGQGQPVPAYNTLIGIFLNVTDFQSPENDATLTIQLQDSPNGKDWYDVSGVTIAGTTGTGTFSYLPANTLIADQARLTWTIAGTQPSFTFQVDLETVAL